MVFADTSALVKLFVREAGSDAMTALTSGQRIAASDLAFAEIQATLGRRFRAGLDDAATADLLADRFANAWRSYTRVPVGGHVLARVAGACRRHPLRAGDAIQLCSALHLSEAGISLTFACNDQRLLAAARAEGLPTADPQ